MLALKKWNVGGVVIFGSRGHSRMVKTSVVWYWMLQELLSDVLVYSCAFFLLRYWKNLIFYSSSFLKLDQLCSFFIFYCKCHRLVEKLPLILFFVMNYIKISLCMEPMNRVAFFHFEKNLSPGNIWWELSCSVNWNYQYFICMINQKRFLSVI